MASRPALDAPGVAPDPKDSLAAFARLKGWVKDSLDRHADWYKEAKECFGFVAGRSVKGEGQWPGTSWQEMIDSGRQPIEFNRCGPIVDAICGMEVNNRQEVKYLPRTEGDAEVDERLTSLGKWARDESQAEDEESMMFRDAVICGRGFTETRIDFDEETTGKIVIEQLDPLECGVDPASKKANFVNARYLWRYRDIATEEAAAMFTGVIATALDASWARSIDTTDGGEGNKRDYPDETRPGLKAQEPLKQVRLVQIQWWERETVVMVAHPSNPEPVEMSEDDWAEQGDSLTGMGAEHAKVERRRYYQAFLGRGTVLEQSEIKCFTIRATTGRLDRNKGYHYGVVRPMRDPQMLANKTLSQVLHILNTNAKGGLMGERTAFADPRKAEKDWSDPSKFIPLNPGGIDKIKERTAPQMPVALVQMQEFSISSIRDVTGVSVELLGLADRDQPASLEYQRRQSAVTILASLFDGLRRYRKLQGHTLLEQLKLMPPGVLVRVLIDPKQAQAIYQQQTMAWQQAAQQAQAQGQPEPPKPPEPEAQFKDPRGEKYDPAAFGLSDDSRFDVIVDEAPSSPNQKEATWATLQPMLSEIVGAFPQTVGTILKYSPLPESAAEEITNAIEKSGQPPQIPPEIQQAIADGKQQIGQLQQENQQLRTDASVKAADAAVKQQDADTRRIKALSDVHADQHGIAIDYMQLAHAVLEAQRQAALQAQQGGGNGRDNQQGA
jgi:hypothetical protein